MARSTTDTDIVERLLAVGVHGDDRLALGLADRDGQALRRLQLIDILRRAESGRQRIAIAGLDRGDLCLRVGDEAEGWRWRSRALPPHQDPVATSVMRSPRAHVPSL